MTWYSVQPRDRIFVKSYEFSSFTKNMGKNIAKNIIKSLSSKYSQDQGRYVLIKVSNLQQMHLKLLQKESFKKQQKQLVIWLVIKLLMKLQESQKLHQKTI